jgi:hypothetical protein
MSYASWNDKIYFTNRFEIRYIQHNESHELVDPGIEFKLPLPPGQLIEQFKSRLYVARGKVLYISDPLCDYYDVRDGYKIFANNITLLRAIDEGMYAGDDKIWWLKGETPEELDRREAYSHRPIMHTDVRLDGQHIGEGLKGKIAMWTGENGICLGDNSGFVENLTEARYVFTGTERGASLIRDINNVRHYITTLF